ncbi:MAG: sugar phosphate nucleotidyltransferase [Candidatus Sifarchaeia archaeon]
MQTITKERGLLKAIIPVAGSGSRLSPITDSKPKALVEVAGAPVLEHIIENLLKSQIDELVLIVGVMKEQMTDWAMENYGDKILLSFVTQDEPLGLGHAIFQADAYLSNDEVLISIGDEIFSRDFSVMIDEIRSNSRFDALVGTMIVTNPSHYGMVEIGNDGLVTRMVEKPKSWDGNLALAGAYYVKRGFDLKRALSELISKGSDGREYQITDALQIMVEKGHKVGTFSVGEGYDCGRPESLLKSNYRMLAKRHYIDESAIIENSEIIEPCFIGKNARIINSTIGPYVSIGERVEVKDSKVSQSIIEQDTMIDGKDVSFMIFSGDVSVKTPDITS